MILTFKDFQTWKIPKEVLKENAFVNFMVGDFQPFTKKHLEFFDRIYKKTGNKVLLIVPKQNVPNIDNPLSNDVQKSTLDAILSNCVSVVDYVLHNGTISITNILGTIKSYGFEPVGCIYCKDSEFFENELQNFNIEKHILPISENSLLAKNLFEALVNDEDYFKTKIPKFLEDRTTDYRNCLEKVGMITEGAKVGFAIFPILKKEMKTEDLKNLFSIIKTYYTKTKTAWDTPISLNDKKPNKVKLRRSLRHPHFEKYAQENGISLLKDTSNKFGKLSIDWGDGSRGGLGSFSKGYSFEANFENDLKKYVAEGISETVEFAYKELTTTFVQKYLKDVTEIQIFDTSATNTTRELEFSSDMVLIDTDNANDKLSDITLKTDNVKQYLSLKYGKTINYIGCGVTRVLKAKEIANGFIIDKNGLILLDVLGIDNAMFCRVFNEYGDLNFKQFHKVVEPTQKLKDFVASGFGIDYTIVHLYDRSFDIVDVDKEFIQTYIDNMSSVTIGYGGISGIGKRVDLIFTLGNKYKIIISIRNQAGGLYPTHITSIYTPITVKKK